MNDVSSISDADIRSIISKEWHPSMNGDLILDDIKLGSRSYVWLRCTEFPEDHFWENKFLLRVRQIRRGNIDSACPFCCNRLVLSGFNDLESRYPDIALEFDIDLNNEAPSQFVIGSARIVSWICSNYPDHKWEDSIHHRAMRGDGCPYCSGHRIITGFNDFATLSPDLMIEWHPTLNISVNPSTLSRLSNDGVWWKCVKHPDHEWVAAPSTRNLGRGCPYCANKKVKSGFNDLATHFPDLAKSWHPYKNGNLLPTHVTSYSQKQIWWLDEFGHDWEETPGNRAGKGFGCPYCSGHRVLSGFNDLATLYPEIIHEWHSTLNEFGPDSVTGKSHILIWWICSECKYEWVTDAATRTRTPGGGCKFCNMKRVAFTSRAEGELIQFVRDLDIGHVESNYRALLKYPSEVDIYVPGRQIAIEYNGLYWHSDQYRNDDYHAVKFDRCEELGVRLIHVWEDDWLYRPEIVRRNLGHVFGISDYPEVSIESCLIVEVTEDAAALFMIENHLRGNIEGSMRFGIVHLSELIAVMIINIDGQTVNILRHASSRVVPGGVSALISHLTLSLAPSLIIVIADRGTEDDTIYESIGFRLDVRLPPDYEYALRYHRINKSEYTTDRFRDDPNLYYEDGMVERQLADANGIPRVYDSGSIRYIRGTEVSDE